MNLDQHLRAMGSRLQQCLKTQQREIRGATGTLSSQQYLSPSQWQAEQSKLFLRYPLIVAREAQLNKPASCMSVNIAGRSILLTRDEHGHIRAFRNACRHRGMALQEPGEVQHKKRISCPYHGWTYELDGRLRGLPHQDAFSHLDTRELGLRQLPCEVRHGFVWLLLDDQKPMTPVAEWLGNIDQDFQYFDLERHQLYKEARSLVNANWKLCIDAFLEAYHVRVLHRHTVGPFFEDAFAVSDTENFHFRSAVARKGLSLSTIDDSDQTHLRQAISFTHFVFPNQVFVFHPDYVSQMSIHPLNERQFTWQHRMLIPADSNTPELKEHWDNSFDLIENGVFQSEDLRAAERIQIGLESNPDDALQAGDMENLLLQFHANVQACLDEK